MKALVLSGGGARGAYEMGVWKALRKMNMKFSIVTGTSIGAINGMMYVQKKYYKCLKLWENVDFNTLFDDADISYLSFVKKGGADISKLKKIVYSNYNEKRLYKSKIKYGVISYNLSEMTSIAATKENTLPYKLREYILASASCFPVFKPTKIDNKLFIDGGFYDNLPINLAISMGATEVLAVDLEAIGLKKMVNNKKVSIDYIRPSSKLESFLMFENSSIKKMINLGYTDTLKHFNKLDGNTYSFKKNTFDKLSINYFKKMSDISLKYNIKIKKSLLEIVEDSFDIFGVSLDKIYNYKDIVKILSEEIDKISFNHNIEDLKKIFDKKSIIKFIYTKFNNNDKISSSVLNLFYDEAIIALFIYSIKR